MPTPKPPRILRKPEVVDKVGVSPTTLWRMTRRGTFPSSFRVSPGIVGWAEADVDAWIEERRRAPKNSRAQARSRHADTVLSRTKGEKP